MQIFQKRLLISLQELNCIIFRFFGAVVMNFFPIILINTDFKRRISWILVMAGTVILAGHYIDFFNMIMPELVEDGFGVSEIASVLSFRVISIYTVFTV
jgi:hypothetical protein